MIYQYKPLVTLAVICLITVGVRAQQGGSYIYDFLNKPNSARIGSLGGNQVGLYDNDLNLVFHNPGMLTDSVDKDLVFNVSPFIAGIKYGYFGYAQNVKKLGTLAVGIHSINYGDFLWKDEYEQDYGGFKAAEYAIMLSYSKRLSNRIIGGITFKPIISNFHQYKSFALLADVGFSYLSKSQLFSAGLVAKNIGSQLSSYDGITESVPTDLQIGFSQKLAHAPFRFLFTFQGLLNWDLEYQPQNPENGSSTNVEETNKISPFDNFMRHTVFGFEFLPTKNFYVAMGYNHRVRQELKIEEKASTVGYSWGFGFKVYKFKFAYGSTRYHLAGSLNMFSLTANLSNFGL